MCGSGSDVCPAVAGRGKDFILRYLAGGLFCLMMFACDSTAGGGRANFYVSQQGDDANAGTLSRPFATLGRAIDAVRQLKKGGQKQDIAVLIRGGTYYVPGGVRLGPGDSGTKQYKITYAAYPGEVPVFVGGVRLAGWRKHKGDVYVTELPEGIRGTQLFENGRRMALARSPNTGYFKLDKGAEVDGRMAFVYREPDVDPTGWDVSEGRVNIWPYHDWFNHNYNIRRIDRQRRLIVLETRAGRLREGNRYYIKNVLAVLDRPGECQISLKKKKIYAWPRSGRIDKAEFVLSTAENVLRIRGEGGRIVRNLHFEGLDLGICEKDAVSITGAEDCSLRFCRIENAAVTGVVISDYARRIVVYGNLIRWHGQHGVSLRGRGPGQADVNHHNIVENNHIHHCGRLIGHGYGVRISQSGHNRVVHNHIHHMPRYGTTIKGSRYGTIKGKIKGMTWKNRYDFMHGRRNLIAYNDIHHTNLDSQDTGAMESWGAGRDNKYDHNLIHDTGNEQFNLQSGIYLDDQADYFTVTNNIIYGVKGTSYNQCIYAKGIGNRIENNILIGNSSCDTGIRSFFMADERCDHHEYLRNIIYFEPLDGSAGVGRAGGKSAAAFAFVNWSDDRVAASDYNVFYKPEGDVTIKGGPADGSLDKWRKILEGRFDRRSIVADPLFVDVQSRDFRLKAGSPALKLGFEPIDVSRIGLKSDFPARFERR